MQTERLALLHCHCNGILKSRGVCRGLMRRRKMLLQPTTFSNNTTPMQYLGSEDCFQVFCPAIFVVSKGCPVQIGYTSESVTSTCSIYFNICILMHSYAFLSWKPLDAKHLGVPNMHCACTDLTSMPHSPKSLCSQQTRHPSDRKIGGNKAASADHAFADQGVGWSERLPNWLPG